MNSIVKKYGQRVWKEFVETARFLFWAAILYFCLATFVFAMFYIPSESMQPGLQVGDRVYVSKFSYGYSRHSLPFGLGDRLPKSWRGRFLGSALGGTTIIWTNKGQQTAR